MIYTVTLNPSIDYSLKVPGFEVGEVNRSVAEDYVPGGKGLNVSLMLKVLGVDSVSTGFVGGFVGQLITKSLDDRKIKHAFLGIGGNSRINVKIEGREETAINASGPKVGQAQLEELIRKLDGLVKDGDVVALCGSFSPSLPDDAYAQILESLRGKRILTVVDATKERLLDTLRYHPFLIKPNKAELEELVGEKAKDNDDVEKDARKLKALGAQNVLVSLGGEGAILIDESEKARFLPASKGKVKSTVGAGDSMVAGFLTGFLKFSDFGKALVLGLSAGSAKAFANGEPTKEEILCIARNTYGSDMSL